MLTFPWSTPDRSPPLPDHTRRLVEAVRTGRGGGLFPPVIRIYPEGVEADARELAGARDAGLVAAALARPRLAPLVARIERLGAWCEAAAARCNAVIAPRVLAVDNPRLFGALIRAGFVACAAARGAPPDAVLDAMFDGARCALARFVRRLTRDLGGALAAAGVRGPVRDLWIAPDESHNGGERVIRAAFRAGGAWAYKPRPATGERMLLADTGSLFAALNALPSASGAIRLPTLRVVPGGGRERGAYSWQEWIERPRQWGTIRTSARGDLALAACRLPPRDAARFWQRAGALTAACFAFGASDLHTGNLVVGRRRAVREPLAYPVDLEVWLFPVERLIETSLVNDERDRGEHHVGFERAARWCTVGGPVAGFAERPGGLQLRRRTGPWARRETASVVADTRGRVGFAAYAGAYLRGMFDLWTKLVCERDRVTALVRRAARAGIVRVLVRPTAAYAGELDRRVFGGPHPRSRRARLRGRLSREERAQLGRLDVPYFFRPAAGGPLRWIDPVTGAHRAAGRQPAGEPRQPPSAAILTGERFALLELGVALRDALAYVFADLPRRRWHDRRRGVRIAVDAPGRGSVAFDWPEADRRVTYAWRGATVTLDVAALGAAR
ncbi:MAG TPA: hypothetical protein VHT91_18355 [Kofleriaceae bacterium]|jgi:hypothetical protein|nr:hypothetical protein [Kofleriaceae bacterium]